MAVLVDHWAGSVVHEDSLPSPVVTDDDNGDYVVRRENGKSSYVKLVIPPAELPEFPEEDGAYVLTVTVDDGEAVLSWESTADGSTSVDAGGGE